MNFVHVLNCQSTRMVGFFDVCKQSCDTLIAGGIRKDESTFLLSPRVSILYICLHICKYLFANIG